jgi:hypothetical protein
MAATPSRRSMWSSGRPRACRSSTASGMRPPAGRCSRPTMLVSERRSPTWTDTWGPAADTVDTSACPDRACWRSASTTGHRARVIRCCIPIWSLPIGSRGRTDAGRPWTAGTCTATAWRRMPSIGPPTSGSWSGHWGWSGRRPTPMATASSRGCPRRWSAAFPSAPARSTRPSRSWSRMVGSGRRGWSSGPSTRPAGPKSTRPWIPCMDGGGRRRPVAVWTRTPWSGR